MKDSSVNNIRNVIAICPMHGPFGVDGILLRGRSSATFANSTATCPICHMVSPIPDGVYGFIGEVVRNLKSVGNDKESIKNFKYLVDKRRKLKGEFDNKDIKRYLHPNFQRIFDQSKDNAALLGLLVAIIGLWLTWYGIQCSNEGSAVAHSDALRQLEATKLTNQRMHENNEEQKRIFEFLKANNHFPKHMSSHNRFSLLRQK